MVASGRMLLVAIVVALMMLGTLITGAYGLTEATLSSTGLAVGTVHTHAAMFLGAIAAALLTWVAIKSPHLRKLAAGLLAGIVVTALLGSMPNGTVGWSGLLHGLLGQVLLAGSIALVVASTASWMREPQTVPDYGWPSLRSLAFTLPVLVALQVALGAAFRHRMLGLMPHIIGAMLVSLFIIMVGSFVLQQCKGHKVLTDTARGMMAVTFAQVFLGIAVYTVRAVPKIDPNAVLWIATAHVTVGALLLSASVVMGMQIRRNVTPKKS